MALNDRWVRLALILFLGICLGFVVLLLPMIRSTPADFQPTVKVRLLDLIQSKALTRTARQNIQAKDFEQSFFAYRLAISNDPGNTELYREYLSALKKSPINQDTLFWSHKIDNQVIWLLRLSEEDPNDILLCAGLMDQFQRAEDAARLGRVVDSEEYPIVKKYFIKRAFMEEKWKLFNTEWMNCLGEPVSAPIRKNVLTELGFSELDIDDLRLHQLAWKSLVQKDEAAYSELLNQSQTELSDSNEFVPSDQLQLTANKLVLRLSSWLSHEADYHGAKARLKDAGLNSPVDECFEWPLIAARDPEGAKKIASDWIKKNTIEEFSDALRVNQVLKRLGWRQLQNQYLDKCRTIFERSQPRIWLIHADFLIADQRWTLLKALGTELQIDQSMGSKLKGLGKFYEGLAEFKTGLKSKTERLLTEAAEFDYPTPDLTRYVAEGLLECNAPDLASQCLARLDEVDRKLPLIAAISFEVAVARKDADEALKAAKNLYDTNPDFPVYYSNLASALISSGKDPELAVQLAEKTLKVMPTAPAFSINAAMAHLLNDNAERARELLEPLQETKKGALELDFWNYAWARIHEIEGNRAEAQTIAAKINLDSLYPRQRDFLASLDQ